MKRGFKQLLSTIPPKSTKNNYLSPQISKYKSQRQMWMEILAWDEHNNMAALNRYFLNPKPLENCIFNGNIDIKINKETCTYSPPNNLKVLWEQINQCQWSSTG